MKASRLMVMCRAPLLALTQTFPAKPIRMVVPYAAGGSADTVARAVGNRLSEALGQPVIIDNRGGASGIIGSDIVVVVGPTFRLTPAEEERLVPFLQCSAQTISRVWSLAAGSREPSGLGV